ncbi:MAG: O-antigen ligase family protein [Anaerolineae bacterium]|jgi:tetratricopeptide (TPR) repeat protein/O-antigen ligase
MRTRLTSMCEAIIEAGWLLAVLLSPLFFNVYSQRVFEPDKIGLIRSLATIMAAFWVVWLVERLVNPGPGQGEGQGGWWQRLRGTRLVIPALLLLGTYLLSTAFSVTPRISFWGSYERLQGTYSLLSYVVIGLSVLFLMRKGQQVERLLLTMVLTSVPVALYGIAQHYGLDPLPWGGDVTERVAGSLGNAIFIAAYLVMVVPVTLAQWLRVWRTETAAWSSRRQALSAAILLVLFIAQTYLWAAVGLGAGIWLGMAIWALAAGLGWRLGGSPRRWAMLGLYQTVLAAQVVCIVFSQSRGPWLGLAAGLALFFVVALVASGRRRIALALGAGALVGAGLLGLLNVENGPLERLRDLPYVGRLGRIFEVQSGTGRVRVLIWQGALEMITDDPLRAVVGYGPESMYVAYAPYYAPELAHLERRSALPDRSHNETYDALITTGVLGFAAYMYLFWTLYRLAMRATGLLCDQRDQWLFLALTAGGGLVGAVAPYVLEGQWRYVGITMPLAMVAGVGVYVLVKALPSGAGALVAPREGDDRIVRQPDVILLVAGFLGAIVAHFGEIHFGIAIGATRSHFWVLAAMLAVLTEGWIDWDEPAVALASQASGRRASRAGRRRRAAGMTAQRFAWLHAGVIGILGAALLSTLMWNLTANASGRTSVFAIVWQSLTTKQALGRPDLASAGVAYLVGYSWLAVGVLTLGLEMPELDGLSWRQRLQGGLIAMVGALMGAGLYAVLHAARMRPPVDVLSLFGHFIGAVLVLWLLLAAGLAASGGWPTAGRGVGWGALALLVLVVALPWANRHNLQPIRADMLFKQGMRFEAEGDFVTALSQYGGASDLAPKEDRYRLYLGRVALEIARREADAEQRQRYLSLAQEALETAKQLNPLNTDHTANLARLHRMWGELEASEALRRAHWERSEAYYAEAHALSPQNAQLLNEWGLSLLYLGERDAALETFERSLQLDDAYAQTYVYLGDLYAREGAWDAAVAQYRQALDFDEDVVAVWSSLGYAASQQGDWETALEANLAVYRRAPDDYNTIKNLAIIHAQLGDADEAVRFGRMALEIAPDAEVAALEAFIAEQEER